MAWTTLTTPYDWQDVDFVNEFRGAEREREKAIGGPAGPADVSAGEDIQDKDFWEDRQTWCLDHCTEFVKTKNASGGDLTPVSWDGDEDIDNWTLATFKTRIAGNAGGFRRYTTHPDDGGTALYGVMQVGDYIGDWIFEDLQAAYNLLVRTKEEDTETAGGRYHTSSNYKRSSVATHGVWATAKTNAETNWDSASEASQTDGVPAECHSIGQKASPGGAFTAWLERHRFKHTITVYDVGVKFNVHFFVFTRTFLGTELGGNNPVYNANSDDVLEDEQSLYHITTAVLASTTSVESGTELGATGTSDKPVWVAEPALGDDDGEGYLTAITGAVGKSTGLISWDIIDGFVYQE